MFIPAVTSPKAPARITRRPVQRRLGRPDLAATSRHTASTTAAPASRNQATPAGDTVSNRPTASAAPTYIETAPTTNSEGAGGPFVAEDRLTIVWFPAVPDNNGR